MPHLEIANSTIKTMHPEAWAYTFDWSHKHLTLVL